MEIVFERRGLKLYLGIDVAIARSKRLPICACSVADGTPVPLALRSRRDFLPPPHGMGNRGVLDSLVRREYAQRALRWVRKLEESENVQVGRIAIDAPRYYAPISGRLCEVAMTDDSISYIKTPTEEQGL